MFRHFVLLELFGHFALKNKGFILCYLLFTDSSIVYASSYRNATTLNSTRSINEEKCD